MRETQETQLRSLGQEEPLEYEMAIHSSILAWKIPWTEEPGGLQSMGHKDSDTTKHTHTTNTQIKKRNIRREEGGCKQDQLSWWPYKNPL